MFQSTSHDKRPATGLRRNNDQEAAVPSKQVHIRPPFLNSPVQKAAADEEEEEVGQKKEAPHETQQSKSGQQGMSPVLRKIIQKSAEEEEEMQMKQGEEEELQAKTAQKKEEEEALQGKFKNADTSDDVVKNGSNSTMPVEVQAKMEHSFGADFSNVNIHKNDTGATQMGALAYTQGNDVHFAPGQYNPSSQKGQELLGHELTHVVQQRQGRVAPTKQGKGMPVNDSPALEKEADDMGTKVAQGKNINKSSIQKKKASLNSKAPIQMLQKDPYPWYGTVSGTSHVSFRSIPRRNPKDPEENRIGILAEGTKVKVIGKASGWNQVEAEVDGVKERGYIYHTYIDDAVSHTFDDNLGEEATWVGSGPGSGNTFETWASASSENVAPSVSAITTINCWEMVLLMAYKANVIDWNWIHTLYTSTPTSQWVNKMTGTSRETFIVGDPNSPKPQRGDLVFFDGLSHVSMATGNNDEIYTFWPPPNTKFTKGGTLDEVKTSTITALSNFMTPIWGAPKVEFGPPIW